MYGKELVTVYTNGNSFKINHIDVKNNSSLGQYEESARIGTILATDVLKSLTSLHTLEIKFLEVLKMEAALTIPNIAMQNVVWAEEILDRFGKSNPPNFADVVEVWRILDLNGNKEDIPREQYTTTVPLEKEGKAIVSEIQVMGFGTELA